MSGQLRVSTKSVEEGMMVCVGQINTVSGSNSSDHFTLFFFVHPVHIVVSYRATRNSPGLTAYLLPRFGVLEAAGGCTSVSQCEVSMITSKKGHDEDS